MRWWGYLTVGLICYCAFLVADIPAWQGFKGLAHYGVPLTAKQTEGTLWSGEARGLAYRGVQFENANWRFQPLALLNGKAGFDLTLSGPGQELQGNAAIGLFGHYYLSDLTGRVKAEVLPKLLDQTFIRPAGDLDIDLALLELSNGRILRAKGKVQWLKARIRTPIPANLDGLEFDLDGQDSTLVIGIHDLKGPIGILGDLTLEPDGKFHLKGRVKPTQAADPSLANSLRSLGRVNADGSITIDYQGQL